jgi:subtilisin family serine protease
MQNFHPPKALACLILALMLGVFGHVQGLVTPGQIIFKTTVPLEIRNGKTGLTAFDSFLAQKGVKEIKAIKGMHLPQYYLANLSSLPESEDLSELAFPGIAFVSPNYLRKLHVIPNDEHYNQLLHYVSDIPDAWNYATGSPLIKVGIVDSGVLIHHPDLWPNMAINRNEIPDNGIDDDGNGYVDDWCGWDFADAPEMADNALGDYIGQDNDVEDENFHGTHVAGIIGAKGNNAIGVVGVCWNVGLVPLRAGFRTVSGQGYLQDDDAAAAIVYAVDNGCQVINMSWGDPNYAPIIADACEYAYSKGVTLIASAGNDAGPGLSYPAKLSTVISVGSVNKAKQLSGFSSYGIDLDLVAVGERVLSTYKLEAEEQYFMQDGTSMSAPFVTGSVALLLSLNPGLSPAEVRGRLLNACDDINAVGFDEKTGHGLLNTRKLLDNLNPPYLEITSPLDQLGISGSVPIIGSAYGDDFAAYTVCFMSLTDNTDQTWKDVTNLNHEIIDYRTQVHNGVLAQFYIPDYFPEGKYLIRLQYEKCANNVNRYNYYRVVIVDRTPPVLNLQSLSGFMRYERQNTVYYMAAVFDEEVRSELHITASDGSTHNVYSSIPDSVQVWRLPATIPEGPISVWIKARNLTGLNLITEVFPNFLNVTYEGVPVYGYDKETVGYPRRPLHRKYDFNGNGVQEYIAMEMPSSGYGTVKAYEPHSGAHIETHSFEDAFWPLDFSNTNQSGQELMLLRGDTAYLWETSDSDIYPNPSLAFELDTGISGAVMADYNNDGVMEILAVKNLQAERVIQAYKRNANGVLTEQNTLSNTTPTNQRNNFVPTIIVENLDGDNYKDILCADTDGDVMVYEITTPAQQFLRWSKRLPVANTYSLATGDFDGNGTKDFFVGGYTTSVLNPDLNFWDFEGFTRAGNDNYTSMGSIMINEVQSQNSITSSDLDGDGKDELILATAPNLYILKYINGKFTPVFRGDSVRNYQVSTWQDENGTIRILANAKVEADTTAAVQWTPQVPFTGPETPANLVVKPLDQTSIKVTWIGNGSPAYRLYRKDSEGLVVFFDLADSTAYWDNGLSEGETYSYAIAARDPAFNPIESVRSLWVSGTPLPKPTIVRHEMVGNRILKIYFNQQMPPDCINPGYYFLSAGMGNPISANSIDNHRGLQLRFRRTFPVIDSLFVLELRNVTGESGVAPDFNTYSFAYEEDTIAPEIAEVSVLPSKQGITIRFSEELDPGPAAYLPNYLLTCPQNDLDNSVISAVLNEDAVTIGFAHPLKHTNSAYYLETNNLLDLAGNLISQQYKLARFNVQEISNLKNLTVYPNPVTPKHVQAATFVNFPLGKTGNLSIYNSGGSLVYKTKIGPFSTGNNNITWTWDLKNNDGRPVSSGVYFYVVEMNDEFKRGKLAVIR